MVTYYKENNKSYFCLCHFNYLHYMTRRTDRQTNRQKYRRTDRQEGNTGGCNFMFHNIAYLKTHHQNSNLIIVGQTYLKV